ncbi:MAG TPA: chromate resistance protein ChrB domain-containing protein [Thermoanaerobaculia bacterium]|jgi:hypothetical protein|nr:chromate resistance protein ChrB domain-containing protein [Thermoanaerobaculia bacterium]
MASRTWYLLIYQIPPKPLYLRAKIRQRLLKAGAVPLKKSAYAVPAEERLLEALRGIARETEEGGGEAYICEARFVDDATEQELLGRFAEERQEAYAALLKDVRRARSGAEVVRRLRARFEELRGIDFFGSPRAKEVAAAIEDLETQAGLEQLESGLGHPPLRGAVWITRQDLGIDRMATAWLIRRYLDPNARFRFVEPGTARKEMEMSFDMPGGAFSHEKDKCTFQVLAARVKVRDAAVKKIGEIVRDIDLRVRKYKHPETIGVEQMIAGIMRAHPTDEARLERGLTFFDDLSHAFSRK